MGRPPKSAPAPVEDAPIPTEAPTERDTLLQRQAFLLALRETMTSEGIQDISKLDALLGQVNARLEQL